MLIIMKKKIIILIFIVFWSIVFAAVYHYSNRERVEIKYSKGTKIAAKEIFN